METIANILSGAYKAFDTVPGTCDTHGSSDALVRREGGVWTCRKCVEAEVKAVEREKWLADRNATLVKIATIPSKYTGQRFISHTPEHQAIRAEALKFRDFIVKEKRWAVLVLTGAVGTGKTLLACEFAESMIKNLSISVRYISANGMIKEIQASYGREGKSEEGEIERFVQYDVLIIDEIDAKPDRENANLLLTEIINRRYSNDKPVIVITNQPFDSLGQFVGDRVDDRLHENAFVCSFNWQSFRRNPLGA